MHTKWPGGHRMALFQRKNSESIEQTADNPNVSTRAPADHSPSNSRNGQSAEFGIGDLVKLLHSLPQQNFDAEISAVVRTIASFDIDIQELIDDISHQHSLATKRLKVLELEIELFKAKIKNRQKEMDLLHIGVAELVKSKVYLEQGITRIGEENNALSRRIKQKRAEKRKKIPDPDNSMPIREKIRIATTKEIDHINKQGKITALRNKFKKRFARG